MVTTISELHCERCGYRWFPLKPELPKTCAACKSRIWQTPKSGPRARQRTPRPDSESDQPASSTGADDTAGPWVDQPARNSATRPGQSGTGTAANATPAGRRS